LLNLQAYVALSRVRSFEAMQVKALPKQSLMVNERVCQFYRDNFPTNPDYHNFQSVISDKQEGVKLFLFFVRSFS
jgi:hypothetical protein